MRKIILPLLLLLALGASAQTFTSVTTGGGVGNDYIFDMAKDASGNTYITGTFEGSVTFGSTTLTSEGSLDMYLAKISSSGSYVWTLQMGGSGFDIGEAVEVDNSGNVYVGGYYTAFATIYPVSGSTSTITADNGSQDMFVLKFNSSGVLQNTIRGGFAEDNSVTSLAIDANGRAYMGGYKVVSGTNIGMTGVLPVNGFTPWIRSFSTSNETSVMDIAIDNNGLLHVVGHYIGNVDLSPTVSFSGTAAITSYIASYNSSGIYQNGGFIDGFSSTSDAIIFRDVEYGNGKLFVSGIVHGTAKIGSTNYTSKGFGDGLLMALTYNSTTGAYGINWHREINTTTGKIAPIMNLSTDGNYVYGAGYFDGTSLTAGTSTVNSKGGEDGFVVSYDVNGNLEWIANMGGSANDRTYTVIGDANGNAVAAGTFSGTASFGALSKNSNGAIDFFMTVISTVVIPDVAIDYNTSPKCPGDALAVNLTTNTDFNTGNTFTVELSDASGSFASPTSIGALNSITGGVVNVTLPSGLAAGSSYKIRVLASDPSDEAIGSAFTVYPKPAAKTLVGPTSVKANEKVTYAVSQSTTSTFHWSVDNGAILSGGTSNQIEVIWGSQNGTGWVYLVEENQNGCKGDTIKLKVTIEDATAIEDRNDASLYTLYPNPAKDLLNIRFTDELSGAAVRIFSPEGKVVRSLNAQANLSAKEMNIDVSDLPAGIYMLEIMNNDKQVHGSFIKQ